jgi:transposase
MTKLKTIKLKDKHSRSELEVFLKKTIDPKERNRIKVLIEVKKGKSKQEIAGNFHMERGTIIDWIKIYNNKGLQGLKTNKGGRPLGNPIWDNKIFDKLIEEIDKQDQYWSIPIMQEWIQKNYKETIPEQTVWYRMNKMNGMSYKSSRPHPYKGDNGKQDVFKKKGYRILSKTP